MTDPPTPQETSPPVVEVLAGGDGKLKRAYWNQVVAEAVEPIDFRTRDWTRFSARMETRRFATAEFSKITTTPWDARVTAAHISVPRPGVLYFAHLLSGDLDVMQEGVQVKLRPGQSIVADTARLYHAGSDRGARFLMLRLDRARFAPTQMTDGRGGPVMLDGTDVSGAVVNHLFRRAWPTMHIMDPAAQSALLDQIIGLLAESLDRKATGRDRETVHGEAMLARAKSMVYARLKDPQFGPAALASAMGVTARYMDTLFESLGATPGEYIRRLRLQIAWDLLTDATQSLSIKQIAQRAGFENQAYFARVFKAQFAAIPRDVRRLWPR